MIFEDDIFKDFIHQTRETESTLDDISAIPRSDRRRTRHAAIKTYSSTYAEFSCDGPKATYISGPSQLSPVDPCPAAGILNAASSGIIFRIGPGIKLNETHSVMVYISTVFSSKFLT